MRNARVVHLSEKPTPGLIRSKWHFLNLKHKNSMCTPKHNTEKFKCNFQCNAVLIYVIFKNLVQVGQLDLLRVA